MKIVSFYTDDPLYRECAKRLRWSCDRLGLDHHIECVPRAKFDTWQDVCLFKPKFIQQCMRRFNERLLWVDADAVVLDDTPALFEKAECDIAMYRDNSGKWYPGTVFVGHTHGARLFIDTWVKRCGEYIGSQTKEGDCDIVQDLANTVRADVTKVDILAQRYAHIFDREPLGDECIVQFQASRGVPHG